MLLINFQNLCSSDDIIDLSFFSLKILSPIKEISLIFALEPWSISIIKRIELFDWLDKIDELTFEKKW